MPSTASTQACIIGTKRLISAVWTMRGIIHDDGTATITSYSRDDHEGYEREHDGFRAHFIESDDDNRTALKVRISDRPCRFMADEDRATWVEYTIRNPKNIFDYKA